MRTNLFIEKLETYIGAQENFLSYTDLNDCLQKYYNYDFSDESRWRISDNDAVNLVNLFPENILIASMNFSESTNILDILEIKSTSLLNKYTFSNFKNKTISYFRAHSLCIRTTRYV